MFRTLYTVVGFGLLLLLPASFAPILAAPLDDQMEAAPEAPAVGQVEYAYGSDPLQKLDFWQAKGTKPAALVVFIHGGGWKRGDKHTATGAQKVDHLLGQGYAFASINYRLVPDSSVEQQASDVASAVAWLRGHADKLGIDPARVVLMGHSAGAHLVALVGTDPQYFAAAGLSYLDIRGVIALDGACYDVARQIADGGRFMRGTYREAFGDDPVRQRALSPTLQAAAPNAPAFLIAHINRTDGTAQSEAFGAALVQAGTPAEVDAFEGKGLRGHMEINRSLGRADYPVTATVDAWLRKVFAAK